jgi:hypothetical protein
MDAPIPNNALRALFHSIVYIYYVIPEFGTRYIKEVGPGDLSFTDSCGVFCDIRDEDDDMMVGLYMERSESRNRNYNKRTLASRKRKLVTSATPFYSPVDYL